VLITFVLGSFIAFLDNFRLEAGNSSKVKILMILAMVITTLKISVSSIAVTIEDGILLVYLTDILKNYLFTFSIFIDFAHLANIIVSLTLLNNSDFVGVLLFFISLIKLFTLYENLSIVETTFINSFKK
jgi:hypothetical protein